MPHKIVTHGKDEPKTGCLWCPLYPWTDGFKADDYNRDADKIRTKEPDGHEICNGGTSEIYNEVDVLVILDSPSPLEDKKGKVSNEVDRKFFDLLFADANPNIKVGYTYAVRCPNIRAKKPTKTITKSCSVELFREIEQRKPRVLMPLGAVSLELLTGEKGITQYAGRVLDSAIGIPVIPNLTAGYVRRFDHEFDNFARTIEIASEVIGGTYEPELGLGEYKVLEDVSEVEALLLRFKDEGDDVSFDTETGSLSPFDTKHPQLLCLSFSNKEGEGFVVPFDHADFEWEPTRKVELIKVLTTFFADASIPKIAQNEKFDRKHIFHALGVYPTNVADTMLIHFTLDESRGTHGLKVLAHKYTGMGGYEKPLNTYIKKHKECDPDKGGSYANIPADVLFPYAAMDADVTIRVFNSLMDEPEFKERVNIQRLSFQFFPRLSDTLAKMEYAGARVDVESLKITGDAYLEVMKSCKEHISRLPEVIRFEHDHGFDFNASSPAQLREILFGYYKETPTELTDGGFDKLEYRWKKSGKGRSRKDFPQVVAEAIEKKEYAHFSTKQDVLREIEGKGNPLAPLLLEHRTAETIYGTFVANVEEKLDSNGFLHGTYLATGTATGRLASANPNLQNIPSRDNRVKKSYVSRFGDEGVIIQADYSQAELRVAASLFQEPVMGDAYRDGVDLHRLTAIDIAFANIRDPKARAKKFDALTKENQKKWRTNAKTINFGVLYGGGPSMIQAALKGYGQSLTLDECKKMVADFFTLRPLLRQGIDDLEVQVEKDGYHETFTGRRRRVPEVHSQNAEIVSRALRQIVNFPVQSIASEMTLFSLILIQEEMEKRDVRSKMILTVHDSIIFDCHVDEFIDISYMAKGIMENVTELSTTILDGLDWSWLDVPICADLEVGLNWGSLVGYDLSDLESDEKFETLWNKMENVNG
jgi:DNA polymerase I-like protein with 3'-5' exonuclease and polymerase domains